MMSGKGDAPFQTFWSRLLGQAQRLIVDHAVLRLLKPNFYRLSDRAFRSSQPSASQVRRAQRRYGIRTIMNLRGANPDKYFYVSVREECERLGIRLVDLAFSSMVPPSREQLLRINELLVGMEYPVIFHCKSGADRAGFVSALYLHLMEGIPLSETGQLRLWPYLHMRHARTGILDRFIETYERAAAETGTGLMEWVDSGYDPEAMDREFTYPLSLNFIVDKVLKRE